MSCIVNSSFQEAREIKRANKRIRSLDQSYILVTMPQGLGDILFFCLYVKEYRRQNPSRKLALVVTKQHFLSLSNLYKDCFEKILFVDIRIFEKVDTSRFTYFYPRIYDSTEPQTHLLDAIRRAMDVPNNTPPYYPTIYISKKEKKMVEKFGIEKGRTILISPEAVSCSIDMTEQEWLIIADILKDKGYKVFFNCGNDLLYNDYPKVFLPIRETLIFTHYAGAFIGFRSGLCDVIAAFSDCKQLIIYPNNKKRKEFPSIKNYDMNPNEKYMEYCSLRRAFPDRAITEFIYDKNTLTKMIEREFKDGKNIS